PGGSWSSVPSGLSPVARPNGRYAVVHAGECLCRRLRALGVATIRLGVVAILDVLGVAGCLGALVVLVQRVHESGERLGAQRGTDAGERGAEYVGVCLTANACQRGAGHCRARRVADLLEFDFLVFVPRVTVSVVLDAAGLVR